MKTKRKPFQIWVLCAAALAMGILGDTKAHAQPGVEAWVQRYSNVTDSKDVARKVVTDPDGNVIVAGHSDTGRTGIDWLIIKYSNAGVALWTNRYNGPGNGDDLANAMAVDGSGNVFVAGSSTGGGGGTAFATIKYSGGGVPLWTNYYTELGNSTGGPTALAVDGEGNVLVTGNSVGSGSNSDYATIKYSGAGVPWWTNRYDGPGNGDDLARAVAVDASGNVFVTGSSMGVGSGNDYATIAYSGAGIPLWTNRYDGPGTTNDLATAVVVDGSGNVFVTGYSTGSGSGADYATIAYSGAGASLWTNRYNGLGNGDDLANALAVDGSGNVFVTGHSTGGASGADYATIAYSSAGVALWTNVYNGPGNGYDEATAVVVDGGGNVFVTGYSNGGPTSDYTTIKYSGEGAALWTNRYNGGGNFVDRANAVAVDGSGNVFVTGYSTGRFAGYDSDFATLAYSGAGVPLWTNRYNGPGNGGDYANAVAVDGNGNVFVTGYSDGTAIGYDYVTIAYSAAGVALWTNRYGGQVNGDDQADAIAVGRSGKVFVTGYSTGKSSGYDYATIAYSDAGVPLWTNRYYGGYARAVAVDGNDNVFVTGSAFNGATYDYATIAYSSAGVALWTNRYFWPVSSGQDEASAVAVDGSGNVFVTGYSSVSGSGQNYATIKYSGAGLPLWTNRYKGPGNHADFATAMAVDGSGNVLVTGYSSGISNGYDYATIKYSGAGMALWTNRYNGTGNTNDYATAVAVDGSGNVFVTGYSTGGGSNYDYATVAYSGAGVPWWTNRYDGQGNGDDYAKGVAVDGSGNVFVTGYSLGSRTGNDYATIAYSNAGEPLWTNRYNGPANGDDTISNRQCLAVAPDGVIVVGGSDADFTTGTITDFAVVKYTTVIALRITAAEKLGNDLRLGFTSQSGNHYIVQARTNLVSGNWINVVTNIPSSGAQTQITVTNALLEPQQFYRIQQSP